MIITNAAPASLPMPVVVFVLSRAASVAAAVGLGGPIDVANCLSGVRSGARKERAQSGLQRHAEDGQTVARNAFRRPQNHVEYRVGVLSARSPELPPGAVRISKENVAVARQSHVPIRRELALCLKKLGIAEGQGVKQKKIGFLKSTRPVKELVSLGNKLSRSSLCWKYEPVTFHIDAIGRMALLSPDRIMLELPALLQKVRSASDGPALPLGPIFRAAVRAMETIGASDEKIRAMIPQGLLDLHMQRHPA